MERKEIESKIRSFLRKYICDIDVYELDEEDELAEYGMNSTAILKLIMDMENEFNFEVCDDDFDSKNFRNLKNIIFYSENKLKAV